MSDFKLASKFAALVRTVVYELKRVDGFAPFTVDDRVILLRLF